MSDSIRELTTRIARGDREAFAAFYRDWFDRTYAEARRVTRRDESFCLDVVQDAMMKVIRSMKPIDSERQLGGFVKTVVRTAAYDRMRSELRRRMREVAAGAQRENECHDEALKERLYWLRDEIESLDEPGVRLLTLRYRFGWTLKRIASTLGLNTGAVDGRIGRTVAKLRDRAGETFDE